ncbi:MAG: hypothetical protein NTX05_08095 [Fusobacteria bacterium]|nr:hypothetical protein [Fusobacteriota bacterium]
MNLDVFNQGFKVFREEGLKALIQKAKIFCINKRNENSSKEKTASDLINNRFRNIQKIPSFFCPTNDGKRINLVTDSIESHSLLGGVATAIIFATMLSKQWQVPLRVITRTTPPNARNFKKILSLLSIDIPNNIEFYSDYDRDFFGDKVNKLDVHEEDIFIATSWWSAEAIRKTTIKKEFIYIIQEVEQFFYDYGDEHLLCSQLMKEKDIIFIVNSKWLYDYFTMNEKNIAENGVYFHPSFSNSLFTPIFEKRKEKYQLFFYARPNNSRNLFYYGVNVINRAINEGIIDISEWDINFVGQGVPEFTFDNGYKCNIIGQLEWKEYAKFLESIDLAISLMYTPHPSYPPFDVLMAGGVVLTNRFMNKQEIDWSKNVILSELNEEDMMKNIKISVEMAKNSQIRKSNFEESQIPQNWTLSFVESIKYCEDRLNV